LRAEDQRQGEQGKGDNARRVLGWFGRHDVVEECSSEENIRREKWNNNSATDAGSGFMRSNWVRRNQGRGEM